MLQQKINTRSGNRAPRFLLGLSAVIMVASVLIGGALFLDNGGGGFFPNLGRALGLLLIAAGNFLSWILNLFYWYRARIRWLGIVLAIQSLPAIFFAGWLLTMGVEAFLEGRASDQRTAIYNAIVKDDVPTVQRALAECGEQCQQFFTAQRALMLASLHRSHHVARHLLEKGSVPAKPSSSALDFYNARTSLNTCEGTYLSSLGALDLAVANQDMEMLALLWPVSDNKTRSTGLWTAARLDRLDMVKFMTGAGDIHARTPKNQSAAAQATQLLVREDYRGKQETLLRAAASGAAVHVGSWLLETRPIDLSQTEIQHALADLVAFALDTNTQRSVSFGHLLSQHGADVNVVKIQDEPALERAVNYRSKALVSLLLELGVDPGSLSEDDAVRLNALLQEPDRTGTYRQNTENCVAP